MKKRLLALALVLGLMMSLVALPAFAAEGDVCTCETACAEGSMNAECPVCGAEGADPAGCAKNVAPASLPDPGSALKAAMDAGVTITDVSASVEGAALEPATATMTKNEGGTWTCSFQIVGGAGESRAIKITTNDSAHRWGYADTLSLGGSAGLTYNDPADAPYVYVDIPDGYTGQTVTFTLDMTGYDYTANTGAVLRVSDPGKTTTGDPVSPAGGADTPAGGAGTPAGGSDTPAGGAGTSAGGADTPAGGAGTPTVIGDPAGITTKAALQDALARSDATVKLAGNIDVAGILTVSRTVTLDLNGYTLKNTVPGNLIHIKDGGNLTITDTSVAGTGTMIGAQGRNGYPGGIYVSESSALTMNAGKLVGTSTYQGGTLRVLGSFTMNGGSIEATSSQSVSITRDGLFTMTGGTITADVLLGDDATMYADGGTINGKVTLGNYSGTKITRHEGKGYTTFNGTVWVGNNATVEDIAKLTVTFDSAGGSAVAPVKVLKGQPLGTLPTPTKDGHTFSGWYTAEGTYCDSSSKVMENMTLYADWDCSRGHIYTRQDTTVAQAVKSPGNCQTKAEYYYVCLYCSDVEHDDNHTFQGNVNGTIHADTDKTWVKTKTTHQEKWACCDNVGDTAPHDWDNGICETCGYACLHSGGTATCKTKASCEICGIPYGELSATHTGKLTWHYTEDQHWQVCGECEKDTEHEPHKFENGKCICGAVKYTVTFDANGGQVTPGSATTNTAGKLAVLPTPTRKDHVFLGWFTAKSGGSQAFVDTEYTQDTTLYALWNQKVLRLDFSLGGHAYEQKLDGVTVTSGKGNLGIRFTGTKNYDTYYGITKDPKTQKTESKGLFQDEEQYYLWVRFDAAEGYTLQDLTKDKVFLDGTAALSVTHHDGWDNQGQAYAVALFRLPVIYTIQTTAGKNGTVAPEGTLAVFEGQDAEIKITPNSGYVVYRLTVDGKNVTTARTYTFKNIQQSHTLKARFIKNGDNAKTGDSFPLGLALSAVVLSAAALTGAVVVAKKKKKS